MGENPAVPRNRSRSAVPIVDDGVVVVVAAAPQPALRPAREPRDRVQGPPLVVVVVVVVEGGPQRGSWGIPRCPTP